jgi:hypothetical protein
VPVVNIIIKPITEAAIKTDVHILALNISATAEQPATKMSKQAKINSVNGFIQSGFSL